MNEIEFLQKELIENQWNDANALVTYIIKKSKTELSLQKIKQLKELADIQIKNNISLKYFIEEESC